MWEIDLNDQLLTFLYSLILGVMLGIFYDIIKSQRLVHRPSNLIIFVADIFFWIVSALVVFLFFLSRTNGEIRGYVLFSLGGGFLLWRITLSRFFLKIICFVLGYIKRVINFLADNFYKILAKIYHWLLKIVKNILKWAKKGIKRLKKLLKSDKGLLYTKSDLDKNDTEVKGV